MTLTTRAHLQGLVDHLGSMDLEDVRLDELMLAATRHLEDLSSLEEALAPGRAALLDMARVADRKLQERSRPNPTCCGGVVLICATDRAECQECHSIHGLVDGSWQKLTNGELGLSHVRRPASQSCGRHGCVVCEGYTPA